MPGRKGLMSNTTKSNVPKTPKQKTMWERARQITAKASGAQSDKSMPWCLTQKIYKNEQQAGKVAKKSDVTKTKVSKTVKAYTTQNKKK